MNTLFRREIFTVVNFDLNHYLLRKSIDQGLPPNENYAETETGQDGEFLFQRSDLASVRRKRQRNGSSSVIQLHGRYRHGVSNRLVSHDSIEIIEGLNIELRHQHLVRKAKSQVRQTVQCLYSIEQFVCERVFDLPITINKLTP